MSLKAVSNVLNYLSVFVDVEQANVCDGESSVRLLQRQNRTNREDNSFCSGHSLIVDAQTTES